MKDMSTATPSGQSVPFSIFQTCFEGKNFGVSAVPVTEAGIIMITTKSPIIFNVDPYELNLAIHSVGILEMNPWMIMMNTVNKNV